ncbi:hypothetical protein CIP107521_02101 [Corynebacterium diphtheriae]|nr:hypothetical protein CIP107521_02101 [Corynebacterium diphtheriae]
MVLGGVLTLTVLMYIVSFWFNDELDELQRGLIVLIS